MFICEICVLFEKLAHSLAYPELGFIRYCSHSYKYNTTCYVNSKGIIKNS